MLNSFFEHSCGLLYQGNALDVLKELPEASVNCCVTSPPYWGLRDYGTGQWSGGRPDCDHVYNHGTQGKAGERASRTHTEQAVYKSKCRKCGAKRIDQQLGLEKTPRLYIRHMVEIFREVRRVLRDDGTLWLNIGDSYNAQPGQRKATDAAGPKQLSNEGAQGAPSRSVTNLKPKDLVGIPWMLAFALRADGWYLRSEIIWHKPNPMPESVSDRPTKAHEQIFLLAKSPRYYYDAAAIAEPVTGNSHARGNGVNPKAEKWPNAWSQEDGRHDGMSNGRHRPKQNESFSAAVSGLGG